MAIGKPIQFIDLAAQQEYLGSRIDDAIKQVLNHGKYIMGPEIAAFEKDLCKFGETSQAVTCSNGTDALIMPLMAWGIGPGQVVFVPSFTFASTAEAVACLGAEVVFVDILPDTFNMDPEQLELAIEEVKREGKLQPAVIIAVDLFGLIADYPAIKKIADKHGLKLVADAAQGFGSTFEGKQAGHLADVVTTSFFPAKPLGCYGDGGALLTNDSEHADRLRSIRVHGKGSDKYDNVVIGMNARLDTLQAAILIEKIAIFGEEIEKRNVIARRYAEGLEGVVTTPAMPDGYVSTWAQYTLTVENRDEFQAALKEKNVPTAVYYAKPLHQQTAYKKYSVAGNGLPVTDRLAQNVVSLPMHPYLDQESQNHIIESVKASV